MTRPIGMKHLLFGFLLVQMSKGLMAAEEEEEQLLPSDEQFHIHLVYRTGSHEQEYLRRQRRDIPAENYMSVLQISFSNASLGDSLQNKLNDPNLLKEVLSSIVTITEIQVTQNLSDITVIPAKPLIGDTVMINCQFSNLTNVSWLYNSIQLEEGMKYMISYNTSSLLSTLTIKNVTANDTGNYTCTGPDNPTTSLQINPVLINSSSNIPVVCDGTATDLTCCSEDLALFNVTWTQAGPIQIDGMQSKDSACSIYTIQANPSQCPSEKSGSNTNYTCTFQGIYGATGYKVIQVTYLKPAIVTITGKDSVSVQSSLSLMCQSDVPNIGRVTWSINGYAIADNKYNISNTGSTLTVMPVTMDWAGIYVCTLYPQNLPSVSSYTVKVLPLPIQQAIQVDPVYTYQICNKKQILNCCIPLDSSSDYFVKFVAPGTQLEAWLRTDCRTAKELGTFCPKPNQFAGIPQSDITLVPNNPKKNVKTGRTTRVGGRVTCGLPHSQGLGDFLPETRPLCRYSTGNRQIHGQLMCFSAEYSNQSPDCNEIVVFNCVISNNIDSVRSPDMQINYWTGTDISKCSFNSLESFLPETPSGGKLLIPCQNKDPTLTGNITYSCNNGKWTSQENCTSVVVFNQFLEVQNLANAPKPEKLMPAFIESLSNNSVTNKETISSSASNINMIVDILTVVSDNSKNVQPETMDKFITTVNTIVDNTQAWTTIKNKSSELLQSVENFGAKLTNVTSFTSNEANTNIQLRGQTLNASESYNETFQLSGLSGGVLLGEGFLSGNSCTVVSVAYSTLKDILPSAFNKTINGLVISTKVIPETKNSDRFNVSLTFSKSNTSLADPDCVFWDFSINSWNKENCSASVIGNTTVCSCNHLTSFAVLMGAHDATNLMKNTTGPIQPSSNTTDPVQAVLDMITYIGLGTSLACLFITLVIEAIVWRSVIKNKTSYLRHVCLVNIAGSLLVGDIFFIIGASLEKTPDSPACTAVAFLSFYFYLALFFWMLTTGLILFYRLVYILHDMSRKIMMIIAFSVGYGCPALIAIITVASTALKQGFTSGKYCWLDYDTTKSFLAFVVPVLAIMFVNSIILCVVIYKLLRPTIGERQSKDEKKTLIQISKSFAVLIPLLGLTWVFGLLVVTDPKNRAFQVIFAIFNSFQPQGSAGIDALHFFQWGCTHTGACRRRTQEKCSMLRLNLRLASTRVCVSTAPLEKM
ncbi:hypothetical protein XELAEV_18028145mg [Xenopus laevis]|uniref:Adhesion G protein-coupled receptor F5 n=1 Tax=Xenopus laevis TaxID=8355 RepID=A0A974CZ33_XENLA|nr:hypothetical protein XELAEV_18028145mg [Xenopus laevis]